MSHRRRCRHSEVLTPVRKSKNGGSPKIGDFRGWVGNPRIPGVGRCLDRGLQMPRGGKPPLARGEQSDPRTAENADCSGFAARPMESRGLCSWGPHLRWGRERKLRQRYLRSISGTLPRGPWRSGGSFGGDPQNTYLSGIRRRFVRLFQRTCEGNWSFGSRSLHW